MDLRLEVVPVPVRDIDQTKASTPNRSASRSTTTSFQPMEFGSSR